MAKTAIFKNKVAQGYYEELSNRFGCYESGVDNQGLIYFAFLNGIIERYTRSEFIRNARNEAEYKAQELFENQLR